MSEDATPVAPVQNVVNQRPALNLATNVLCEYVQGHLRDGWEIVLRMSKDECSLVLEDPYGNDIEYDPDTCAVLEMCGSANDIEAERGSNPRCGCGSKTDLESESGMGGRVSARKFKCVQCKNTFWVNVPAL